LTYPSYNAVHIWWTMTTQWAALGLLLCSLILHSRHLERGPAASVSAPMLLGQCCYVLSLLEYEAFAFLPLALAPAIWQRSRAGQTLGRTVLEIARALSPYAISLVAVVVSLRLAGPQPRPLAFSVGHLFQVYGAALRCTTLDVLALTHRSFMESLSMLPAYAWGALLLGAALLAASWAAADSGREPVPEPRRSRLVLLLTGAVVFCASYLPYALSGAYTPRIFGVMNRVNLGGGIGAGIILAVLLTSLPKTWRSLPLRSMAVGSVLAAFGLCHWATGDHCVRAWRRQREIVTEIAARLPPGPATVLLRDTPATVEGAPVFQNHYDLSYALALLAGREDVAADWIYEGRADPTEFVVVNGDGNVHRYPYERLFVYAASARRLVDVLKPAPALRR
jgi:hypothetical protein